MKNCSKSVRLQGHLLGTALFGSPHRFSIGFRSGLWLVKLPELWSSGEAHPFLDLEVSIGSLLCWKMKFLFTFIILAEARMFCAKIDCYLEVFIILSTLIKAPVAAEEKHPQSIMLPLPCFIVGTMYFWWCTMFFCTKYTFGNYGQKIQPWSLQIITTFSYMLLSDWRKDYTKK